MASSVSLITHLLPQVDGLTILDLGCGDGLYGALLRICWGQTRACQRNPLILSPVKLVGLDANKSLLKSKLIQTVYDRFLINTQPYLPFKDKEFETILCVEVIEHFTKPKAQILLTEMDRVASRQIILSIPKDPLNKRYLPYQGRSPSKKWPFFDRHRSSFSLTEFDKKGYRLFYQPKTIKDYQPVRILKFLYWRFLALNWLLVKEK